MTLDSEIHSNALITRQGQKGTTLWVAGNKGILSRILENLSGNAIRFTKEGGVRINLVRNPHFAIIEVSDSGIGIDDAFLEHIFEPFRQESEGADRRHEGSGLGLSITRQLVQLLGGTIRSGAQREKAHASPFRFLFGQKTKLDLPRVSPAPLAPLTHRTDAGGASVLGARNLFARDIRTKSCNSVLSSPPSTRETTRPRLLSEVEPRLAHQAPFFERIRESLWIIHIS